MQKGYILVALLLVGFASANFYEVAKEFTLNNFNSKSLSSWNLVNFKGDQVANCNGVSVVGGPSVVASGSMTKTFTTDFDLNGVNISFDLYFFDKWFSGWDGGRDQNTLFKIFVNNQQVYQLGSDYTRSLHADQPNLCGDATPDRQTHISLDVPATGRNITVQLVANIASNNPAVASWGIRNFYILSQQGYDDSQVVVSELNDDSNFDVSQWQTNFKGVITQCPSKLLGGYNAAGPKATAVRKLASLPAHSFLTVSLSAYFIDSIDANDSVVIYVDGKVAHEHQKAYYEDSTNVCGAAWNDGVDNELNIIVPHFASTAEIKIYVNTDQAPGDESFGFREFQVSVSSPCPILYTDVNQGGRQFSFCGNLPDLKAVGWTAPIKGIYLPKGVELTVYQDSNYNGKKYTVKKSNFNLSGNEYQLINKALNIDVTEQKLRRNK
ncbi:carboxy-terminal crystallin fold protein (macronuclear) [Tetrahymena thermophila SB210]|uniref:Carboxy-terminal crystallin fold protein n=2 Tax=Tetrahymena thermophila TaxID=5911 RepID=Q22D32_TETTS|nr:carboxy-terminal crystallin fold protein [Tetrahymena thermophila SB210]ABC75094.1 C-terminal crystallin fold containing protein 3p [Tetrahymena thermophila]EAR83221.3 carboxy-terminal crystallin fold protein [Tetrahymena thermophila SB210]|eukprot:XP_001030884.3 carboxy-terminal crystallin fold protein [Tetrahymena thermophila SB210]